MRKLYQMMFTIYSWVLFVSLWMLSTLTAVILSMDTKEKENVFNAIERFFSRIAFKLLGMKVEIQGLENIPRNEPVIFISNHQSMMDIKLSLAFIPVNFSFISKDTVFYVPVLGAYMTASGHIPIQRTEDRKAYATLLTAVNKLTEKKSLVVFPEGTRSEDGKLGIFKRGISLIVLKSGRRVVPMAICGSNQFMPKRGWLSHPEKRSVRISFGKPLSFDSSRTDREYTIYVINKLQQEVSELMGYKQ
ncbi:MAG: 1-acyl-sn-glycerol-3-phosphate acyltransferase [Candidatus Brocadia sp. AMX2]|nr:MAG: 1-acyl-sn-glycerol-3-phosphate acyltransferase [Candidatus Brocadia sp. AMX2]MBC6932428.1 1-acyl-sn-glycerol-3-phosphate acyltransferase [Candidatus Brocadia sp.]MBL1170604.1 1-acyl-sn-glycerol-3-phosphate acyltransferase [Candidatus Brocadia sp. AMX1]MCK6468557.1 1-acyl-sn-glycerol-3-phosphate acyltransferase [Candidatus Brocadia sinica]MCE7866817.1 1-acyl-sn-glycerol-3-phosphate acyltransferase [Candidatus Brocadia sp. AMX2]